MKSKITAIIPCRNEEDCIRDAIQSVIDFDEVIVVDSFSTDNTEKIATSFSKVKWIQHEYINSAAQKNWIIPQSSNLWVLILDADEKVTPDLMEEIRSLDLESSPYAAYTIPRQNFFFGKKLKHIWRSDKVRRLLHRDLCRYQDLEVHSKLEVNGNIGTLHHALEHHSFKTMDHYKDKLHRYARWSANDYNERTGAITLYHLWIKPAFRFFKHFVIQGGFLDGKAGFTISRLQAWAVYRRYVEMKSLRQDGVPKR